MLCAELHDGRQLTVIAVIGVVFVVTVNASFGPGSYGLAQVYKLL